MNILYVAEQQPRMVERIEGLTKAYTKMGKVRFLDLSERCKQDEDPDMVLKQTVEEFEPEFIHIDNGYNASAPLLKDIQSKGVRIILCPDFSHELSSYFLRRAKVVDKIFTLHAEEKLWQQYRENGITNLGHTVYGVDLEVMTQQNVEPQCDIIFFGNNYRTTPLDETLVARELVLNNVARYGAKQGWNIHIYTSKPSSWAHLTALGNVTLFPYVNGVDFAKACSSAKIALIYGKTSKITKYTSWKRLLQCLACKTCCIVRHVPGLEEIFNNQKQVVFTRNLGDILHHIEYYLEHASKRQQIAMRGFKQVPKFTFDKLVEQYLEV